MSPHRTPRRRPATFTSLIALTATLVAASLGLAACGGSSSTTTTTQTAANAAATDTSTTGAGTATSTTGTSAGTTGTNTTGTSSGTAAGKTATSPLTGTSPAARAARLTALRTCLSKKGITLPPRTAGAGGLASGAQLPKGMTRAQFAEALQSCGTGFDGSRFSKRGKGFKNPFNNPRFHTVLARFATCLRQNGIDIGEPNTSGKGPIFDTKGINTGSPQFKAATTKCRSTLLYALKPSHAHPGAAGTTTTG